MRIGVVQGRLLPPVNGLIQRFPGSTWRDELFLAAAAGFDGLEWIYSSADENNPIASAEGTTEIRAACRRAGSAVLSGCYDALMSERLWSGSRGRAARARHLDTIRAIAANLETLDATHLVLPLLGDNVVRTAEDRVAAADFIGDILRATAALHIEFHLETSLRAPDIVEFISTIGETRCRITFDTGNQVQFGFDYKHELRIQAPFVGSVHLKDASASGTVPFGSGEVDFTSVGRILDDIGYAGDWVVQGARIPHRDPADVCAEYLRYWRRCLAGGNAPRVRWNDAIA